MKIRSAVPENGCLTFLTDGKNKEKTSAKHIRIRLLPEGGCVNDGLRLKRQIMRRKLAIIGAEQLTGGVAG